MKKIIRLAVLPNYRPGYGSVNVVYHKDGLCPTITYNAGHGNSPLIMERAEDEDKDRE